MVRRGKASYRPPPIPALEWVAGVAPTQAPTHARTQHVVSNKQHQIKCERNHVGITASSFTIHTLQKLTCHKTYNAQNVGTSALLYIIPKLMNLNHMQTHIARDLTRS